MFCCQCVFQFNACSQNIPFNFRCNSIPNGFLSKTTKKSKDFCMISSLGSLLISDPVGSLLVFGFELDVIHYNARFVSSESIIFWFLSGLCCRSERVVDRMLDLGCYIVFCKQIQNTNDTPQQLVSIARVSQINYIKVIQNVARMRPHYTDIVFPR